MVKNFFKLFQDKEKEKHNNKVFIFQTHSEKIFFQNGEKKHTQIKNDRTLGKGLKKKNNI